MTIPYPTLRKVEDQADNDVPIAKLLLSAISLLADTEDFAGYTDDKIFNEILGNADFV